MNIIRGNEHPEERIGAAMSMDKVVEQGEKDWLEALSRFMLKQKVGRFPEDVEAVYAEQDALRAAVQELDDLYHRLCPVCDQEISTGLCECTMPNDLELGWAKVRAAALGEP